MSYVDTTFWYFKPSEKWTAVKPYWFNLPAKAVADPEKLTNEESIPVSSVRVYDIRSESQSFQLDVHGFQVETKDFSATEDDAFWRQEFTHSAYISCLEPWLANVLGAVHVSYLSGSIRKRDSAFPKSPHGTGIFNQPIQGVHVDFTAASARANLERKFGFEEAQRMMSKRIQILNIWRPLFGPIRDWPLGLMDCRSVNKEKDLIASDVIYPHYVGESFNVFHNESHRWYYLSDHMPEEVFIFKSYDSYPNVASLCPHASFDLGMSNEKPRESVETIVLVVYP